MSKMIVRLAGLVGCVVFVVGTVGMAAAGDNPGIEVEGFVESSYIFNLQTPPDNTNQYYPYLSQHNTFDFGSAHVAASGSMGDASFVLEVDGGQIAHVNGGGALDVQEAYASYSFDDSISLTAGKFVTFEGIDLIESPDNPVITHGLLYWLAEPLFHVGAYATLPIGDDLEVAVGVVNGWDEVRDSDESKTLIGRLGYSAEDLSAGVSGTFGKEGGSDSERLSLDLTGAYAASDTLAINFQGNFGTEDLGTETVTWMGGGIQPVLDVSDDLTLSARGELFIDDDGFRTGTGEKQTFISVTGSVAHHLEENTSLRLEVRADISSDNDLYVDSDGVATSSQLTAAAQMIYRF